MIIEAWRSEDLFRSYFDQLFLPALSEAGLMVSIHKLEVAQATQVVVGPGAEATLAATQAGTAATGAASIAGVAAAVASGAGRFMFLGLAIAKAK